MFDNKIRQHRELLNLSQVELGRRTKLAPQNISGFERGTLAVWSKARLALSKALKVPVVELFPEDGDGQTRG